MNWLWGSTESDGSEQLPIGLSKLNRSGRNIPTDEDASVHKDAGNACFNRKDYEGAVYHYTKGLVEKPTATLFSNRSAAFCELGQFHKALADAEQAEKLDPMWAKVFSRKGKADYGLKQYKRAADDFARGLSLSMQFAAEESVKRDKEIEALTRQSSNHTDAYLKLLDENAQLRRQIDDYRLMFDDWAKKQM
ncbi:hypothetical protein DYB37_007424 [Aphanomyces astaci]|uniref:CHIP N-terminal tetratricopeptide repeat domain-containing protein n=2 Tax=Aphanomyces astaci TaxID=112090 RepID=A0A397AY66_APHAT|nr:hypothetical protein DYB36_004110 [Aphanomyces astaci]RHY22665.1 hypothetical protein DYB25_005393 [Aphanomyces astaci]RHY51902.1 hypothetical protein DYB34_013442 [Aphanomyces astaci]RHY59961.1 hypothetical protein DYB38_006628 [Aphanomyces astaci]RHY92505.1 hypothetical protein DYB35_008220 [Aphanomyces astaci]